MKCSVSALVCCIVFGVLVAPAPGEDWAGWRGDGSGISVERGIPEKWGRNNNIRWKTRIEGNGNSSPIVWGDRIFLTTALEGTEAVLSRWAVLGLGVGLVLLALVALTLGRTSNVRKDG